MVQLSSKKSVMSFDVGRTRLGIDRVKGALSIIRIDFIFSDGLFD
jgi:hypothetical protein